MKPAWDSLAQQFAKSDKVFVGDVDCTASGKELCERIGVQGFPTIKYFNPPDTDGEDYEGGRDEEALVEFAKTLGPGCSASTLENCSKEQKAEIEALLKLPEAELTKQLEELKAALDEKEKAHDKFVEGLQALPRLGRRRLAGLSRLGRCTGMGTGASVWGGVPTG